MKKLLHQAVTHGFVHVDTINLAISGSLRSRFLCGNLDLIGSDPYASIPYSTVDSLEQKLLTKQIVTESVVLLQNPQQILPFNIRKLKQIAVIGPSANDITVQAHTYHGTPSRWITKLDGIQAIASNYNVSVVSTYGAQRRSPDQQDYPHAIQLANASDVIIFVGGLDESLEVEDTDRSSLQLPGGQLPLIKLLMDINKPLAILIISGSPIAEPSIVQQNQIVLLWVSYLGQSGDALGEILFGLSVPSGCLPFTISVNTSQLSPIGDYSMTTPSGRTYRYLNYNLAPPSFPFGYGLSYSNFTFTSNLTFYPNQVNNVDMNITANITITNQGPYRAQYVIQFYYEFLGSTVPELPLRELFQFTKEEFDANEQKTISFTFCVRNIPNLYRQQLLDVINFWIGNSRDRYAQATLTVHFDS